MYNLPLSHPAMAALVIFAFRSAWTDMFPLPVALALLRGAYASESYGPIMAGAALSAVPLIVIFLIANRRIVDLNRKARQARKEIPHIQSNGRVRDEKVLGTFWPRGCPPAAESRRAGAQYLKPDGPLRSLRALR